MAAPANAAAHRPLRAVECIAFAWILGLLLSSAVTAADKPFLAAGAAGAAVAAGLLVLWKCAAVGKTALLLCGLGIVAAGAAWTAETVCLRQPLLAMSGQTVTFDAVVKDRRTYTNDHLRYTLRTTLDGHSATLEWYADANQLAQPIQIADHVTLSATLAPVESNAAAAAGRGVYLSIRQATVLAHAPAQGFSLRRVLRQYRSTLTDCIAKRLPPAEAGLLLAMLFGDKYAQSDTVAEALYHTGIGHITAVSGLHLVFFCSLLAALFRRLGLAARWTFVGTIAAALLFSLLVEQSVSILRAAVMLLLSQAAGLFGRYSDTLRSLSLAILICTVPTPHVIGSASFWLSVSGVFGIGVVSRWMTDGLPRMEHGTRLQRLRQHAIRTMLPLICVAVTVFPVSILCCGESSLLAPLGNLLLLPLATLALNIGLLLVCTGGLTAFLLPVAGVLCRLVTALATTLARIPGSHLASNDSAMRWVLLCGVCFVGAVALTCKRREMVCGAALVVALVLAVQTACLRVQQSRQLRIAALGKPNELALVVQTGGYTCVLDETCSASTAAAVDDYLSAQGISRIDALILQTDARTAAYQTVLAGCTVATVYLLTASTLRAEQTVCGCVPQAATASLTLEFAGSTLTCAAQSATLTWEQFTVSSLPARVSDPQTASTVIRYGGTPTASDCCGIWLLPAVAASELPPQAYGGQNNWLITVAQTGLATVTSFS